MQLSNILRYPAFVVAGLVGTAVLIVASELIGFSRANFVAFAGPSYAVWVYPLYFLISFLVFSKVFNLPKKAKYWIVFGFVIFLVWYYLSAEGNMFTNPIPFGIDAI